MATLVMTTLVLIAALLGYWLGATIMHREMMRRLDEIAAKGIQQVQKSAYQAERQTKEIH